MATFERHEGRNLKGIDPDAKDRDLEQYGVWVKAEPQDVLDEPEGEDSALLSDGPDAALVLDESFLTDEEEGFLGAGKGSGPETAEESGASSSSGLSDEADPSIPDFEEASLGEEEDLPRIPDMAEFESMEDLGVPIEEFTPEAMPASPSASHEDTEFQDVSDFGLEEPEPLLEAGAEGDFEAIDIDLKFDDTLPPRPAAQGGRVEREAPAPAPTAEGGFETVTDFDDFLNNPESQAGQDLEPEPVEFAAPAPAAKPAPSSVEDEFSLDDIPELSEGSTVDDLAELERDLTDSPGRSAERAAPGSDASSDILLKIAGELSSIKEELVSLKSQIAAMKAGAPGAFEEAEEPSKSASGKAGGFFDDEEDETIALTGDELDNILNTAEFSEENAETGPEAESAEAVLEAEDLDLLPETGEYSAEAPQEAGEEPGIEEIHLASEDDEPVELASEAGEDGIAVLAEEGVAPMTPPPEDTSYLEEDAEEPEDLQLTDEGELPEAPIQEPTPEELNIDDLVEDHFEDAEELPLAEFESAEGLEEPADLEEESEEELEELTLELDSEPSPIVLEAPEHIELPIPEIEEAPEESEEYVPELVEEAPLEEDSDAFGEIALHEEKSEASAEDVAELEPVDAAEEVEPTGSDESESLLVEDLEPESSKPEPVPNRIKDEVRSVLTYLDKLLESLPEEKIEEFAKSEHFETYKRLFEELGLV